MDASRFFWAALLFSLSACGSKDNNGAGGTSNTSGVAGSSAAGAGAGGQGGNGGEADDGSAPGLQEAGPPCGKKSCNSGEICCEGACGACFPQAAICPPNPCGDAALVDVTSSDVPSIDAPADARPLDAPSADVPSVDAPAAVDVHSETALDAPLGG